MYSKRSGLIVGFHGCDKSIRDKVLTNPEEGLKPSNNIYDWLGSGIYFWNHPVIICGIALLRCYQRRKRTGNAAPDFCQFSQPDYLYVRQIGRVLRSSGSVNYNGNFDWMPCFGSKRHPHVG